MQIEVEKMPETPVELEENVSVQAWEMDSFDIVFVDPIRIRCRFVRIGNEIVVEADIVFTRDITCSRCLNQVRQTVTQDFKKTYDRLKIGQYLELDGDIREEILINFPMKVLCKPDCKGICTSCGVNLNIENCRCG